MQYTSDELFHFVGCAAPTDDDANFETLKTILGSGWISHPPHRQQHEPETLTLNHGGSLPDGGLVVPQVVCFADIPPRALGIHISKYGRFGLSLSREYLVSIGVRPVTYFPLKTGPGECRYGAPCLEQIAHVHEAVASRLEGHEGGSRVTWGADIETLEDAADQLNTIVAKEFLAFLKPFDSRLPHDHDHNFYMEREWRRLGNVEIQEAHVVTVIVPQSHYENAVAELEPFERRLRTVEDMLGP
ncbi:MAG: hypothetical protein GY722_16350 [bacterium]|nr:hypothetical protein [bacterium]